ncbi:hypothetical protein NDU88_003579 [Pleurodeles waltl]|uniref:Uncharacterized protein n=1 Tax=Pleurodeles waltl TaxID=8319 RepID=A0AAV7M5I1_PLEWA|nr:hypothetical protein NDU88_003579 [Pleurodeles waltl]
MRQDRRSGRIGGLVGPRPRVECGLDWGGACAVLCSWDCSQCLYCWRGACVGRLAAAVAPRGCRVDPRLGVGSLPVERGLAATCGEPGRLRRWIGAAAEMEPVEHWTSPAEGPFGGRVSPQAVCGAVGAALIGFGAGVLPYVFLPDQRRETAAGRGPRTGAGPWFSRDRLRQAG